MPCTQWVLNDLTYVWDTTSSTNIWRENCNVVKLRIMNFTAVIFIELKRADAILSLTDLSG